MAFTNTALRTLVRAYPFSKGKYRLFKLASRFIRPSVEVTNLFGQKLRVDLSRGGLHHFFYFIPERYEIGTRHYLQGCVGPGMVVVDIGAHIGFHTLVMAQHAKEVHAIELFPPNYKLLLDNIIDNGLTDRVTAYNLAMGKEKSKVDIFISGDDGSCSIKSGDRKAGKVTTMTLDYFRDHVIGKPIDLIKIDAEEAEEDIIIGGLRTIELDKPIIICETHSTDSEENNNVRPILYRRGYRSYYLDGTGKELGQKDKLYGLQNILYIK